MGFFSWKTQDTDRSISNKFSDRGTFPVKMLSNYGKVWIEENYEGYGDFGGMDYYALLAEMNGYASDRNIGIDLWYKDVDMKGKMYLQYPKLVEVDCDIPYVELSHKPVPCEDQGYFYE